MITSNGYYDDKLSLEDAVVYLRKLLAEFPFADWQMENAEGFRQSRSQAVHVTAMLSQFAGGLIPRESLRLGYIYDSNTQRSGKSLLTKMVIIPSNGRMASQSWSPKDEELRKVLDAETLRGSRYIIFDNVKSHVSSQVLEGFMTSPTWTGRLLGKTQMFEAANLATIFITGNDLSVSPDVKHRTLEVAMFVPEANVQSRKVKHPIDDAWLMNLKHRREILNVLWAIVRHWEANGKPLATENLRIGYERWCEVFAGLTIFAGFGDPLAESEGDEEEDLDTEGADARTLMAVLAEPLLKGELRRAEYEYQQVVNVAHDADLFDWILDGKQVEIKEGGIVRREDFVLKSESHSKFGKLLKRYAPFVGQEKGPKHRLFRIGKGEGSQLIRTSSTGRSGRRKFVVELPPENLAD